VIKDYQGEVGGRPTYRLQSEETDKSRDKRVVRLPTEEKPVCESQALVGCQHSLNVVTYGDASVQLSVKKDVEGEPKVVLQGNQVAYCVEGAGLDLLCPRYGIRNPNSPARWKADERRG